MKQFFKISIRVILGLLALIILILLLIQTSPVQNFLIGRVTSHFSKKLQTAIRIEHIDLSFFNKVDLEGVLIRDQKKDTLLYAGALSGRITDWFFLKDNPEIQYAGLQDAVIKLKRTDSVWNYQFIVDYFATDEPADTSAQIKLNLKKIDIKNLHFLQDDGWYGQRMVVKTGSLLLDADSIDFNKPAFYVKSLDIDKPYFELVSYKGSKPPVKGSSTITDTTHHLNPGNIFAQIQSLGITKGKLVIRQENPHPHDREFDGTDIEVSDIEANFKSILFINDTLKTDVKLTAKERSGLDLKELSSKLTITPAVMEFDKLRLRTRKSTIGDYIALRYKNFNTDMADFLNKVTIQSRIKNASIHADDIAFFAPDLKSIHQSLTLSGNFNGTVSNFTGKNLDIKNASGSSISGTLTMKGLPDANKTTIQLENATVITSIVDIGNYLPSVNNITNPDLKSLGRFSFTGNYNGTFNSFKADGILNTNLGNLKTNIAMAFPIGKEPSYEGYVSSNQFNLGKFLALEGLENVNFDGDVKGSSFALDKLKTSLNGNFSSLTYKGYTYQNIRFNGDIQKQKINGELTTEDPNFSFTSSIQVDLTEQEPRFNILGDLALARLKKLNLTKEDYEFSGLFDLNFQGSNIDKFLGSAKILNASLLHNNDRIEFDSLAVTAVSGLNPGEKTLRIESNEFNALVQGRYNILSLPNSVQSYLHNYYPSYIKAPVTAAPPNQDFTFSVQTGNFDYYANLIDSSLSGVNNALITGRISNKDTAAFNFFLQVPFVRYKKYQFNDAVIIGKGTTDSLLLNGDVGRIYLSDSLFFPNTQLVVKAADDHSLVSLHTKANTTLNDAILEAEVFTMSDGVRIDFLPSSFVLNDKTWVLDKEGELLIKKNFAQATNMRFSHGFQEISIESDENELSNVSSLVAKIKNLNLSDIMPLLLQKPVIEGVANGEVYLRDFYGKFKVEADLKASQFRLDNDSIGLVGIKGKYNSDNGRVSFDVLSNNDKYVFSAEGVYNANDSTGMPLQTNMKLKNTSVALLNNFLGNIFSDISGLGTGNISISGDPKAPQLMGKVALHDAALTVNYTQVRYFIDSANIEFNEQGIDFGKFNIKDTLGNTGTVEGMLYEKGFNNMRFNFLMRTPQLLLLDTKPKDNPLFYGRAIGKATLSFTGPLENMYMNIKGEVTDSSHLYKPNSVSKESADADYIIFKQYGTEQVAQSTTTNKLSIDLELTANNKAQIDVILDDITGDRIEAYGNGTLKINIPAQGNLSMNGRYNIEGGKYDFSFQSIVKKPFILKQNSGSYIEWRGDATDANINVKARYTAEKVNIGELANSAGFGSSGSIRSAKENVYVEANLTGKLMKPEIDFSFAFDENSLLNNDDNFQNFLKTKLENNDNEMLKQVTWLIVFNAFAPYQGLTNSADLLTTTSVNTISQKLAGVLDNAFSEALRGLGLDLDLGTSFYSSNSLYGTSGSSGTLDRQRVDLKLNKSLLDGKVVITFGGDIDINWGATSTLQNNKVQWLPDLSVQIILSPDRRLRAIIFNRNSFDVSGGALGRRNRQGVSISYSKDVDKLENLFTPVNKIPN